MGALHRLAVYYGLREDRRLEEQMDREIGARPWRIAAFALGLLVIVAIPTLLLIFVLDRSLTLGNIGRTAAAVLAALVVAIGLINAIEWTRVRNRQRKA